MGATSDNRRSNPPTPEIHIMADDFVRPAGEFFKPVIIRPMKPVKITQVIDAAVVVARNGNHLNVRLAENGQCAWHVARAGNEQKSFQAALLHQCRDFESLIMRVTANPNAVPLDLERNMICEVVTNRIRLGKHPALMGISTATQDQQRSPPHGRKRESCTQSVRSRFQMKSRGL